MTSDISLGDTARAAELFLSDGVIVTGSATGMTTSPGDVSGTVNVYASFWTV